MSSVSVAAVINSLASLLGGGVTPAALSLDGWGRADAHFLLASGIHVFIELETALKHPSTNVLKFWPWLESRSGTRELLIHAILEPPAASPTVSALRDGWVTAWSGKCLEGFGTYCWR